MAQQSVMQIIDDSMLDLIEGLFYKLGDFMGVFLADAQALCAIFMLLYFGIRGFGMVSGDEKLEIMPLLRPFALALVIIFWGEFIDALNVPAKAIRDTAKEVYDKQDRDLETIATYRYLLIDSIGSQLSSAAAELEHLDKGTDEKDWYENLGISFDGLWDSIKGYYILLQAKISFGIYRLIDFLGLCFFQICAYVIFFLQVIFAGLLIIFGPFSFAFSVLPAFKESYVQWISRYVAVSFFIPVAYVIMAISLKIVEYGLERDIDLLEDALSNDALFLTYVTSSSSSNGVFYLVSLLVGGIGLLAVPTIATWIVAGSGVGNAISTAFRGAASLKK